jgi:hypothetical protein
MLNMIVHSLLTSAKLAHLSLLLFMMKSGLNTDPVCTPANVSYSNQCQVSDNLLILHLAIFLQ